MIRRAAAAAALACALPATGQVLPDAGGALRDLQKPAPAVPQRTPPRLEVPTPERAPLKPAPDVRLQLKGFRFSGNTAVATDELQRLLSDMPGREVSFEHLGYAVARVTHHYRRKGFLLARAYLPQQEIRDGVVEIAVLEGRLGKFEFANRSRVRDSVVRSYFAGLEGEVLNEVQLERKMLLLGDLAGAGAAAGALRPGDRVGESALGIEIGEQPLAAATLGLDNYGSYFTGEGRLTGEVELASLAGLGDALSARAIAGSGLESIRLAYQVPLGGDGLRVGVAYSDLRYELGKDFKALDADGSASAGNVSLTYPLLRSRASNIVALVDFARRDFEDRIGATATRTDKRTDIATFGLSADWRDGFGGGGANAWSLAYGAGDLEIQTPAALAIDDATLRTNGSYNKLYWSVLRNQRASDRISLYAAFSGQQASKNLDSSEKFSLGGPYAVRGYPVGEAAGDVATLGTFEVRFEFLPAALQGIAFFDAGRVKLSKVPLAGTDNERSLQAVGFGLNVLSFRGFTARGSIAWGDEPSRAAPNREPRGWIQVAQRF